MSDSKIDQILSDYDSKKIINKQFTEKIKVLVKDLLQNKEIEIHSIESRLKDRKSFKNKLQKAPQKYRNLNDITDVCGLRIITYFEDDVDKVASIIEEEFKIDRENSIDKRTSLDPDRFGYLSLHYIAQLNNNRLQLTENEIFEDCLAEIQVRSILQHAWAEIEHDLGYKTKDEVPKHIRRQFSRLAGLLELADQEFVSVKNQLSIYAKEVSENKKEDEKLLLDKITIQDFIKKSEIVKKLDSNIAKETNMNLLPLEEMGKKASNYFATNLLSILKYFGLTKISEVKTQLEQESNQIIEFAKFLLKDSTITNNLYEGVCLFHFGYYYAASQEDKAYLMDYLTEINVDTDFAEEITDIYRQVA